MTWATGVGLGGGRARATSLPPSSLYLCVK